MINIFLVFIALTLPMKIEKVVDTVGFHMEQRTMPADCPDKQTPAYPGVMTASCAVYHTKIIKIAVPDLKITYDTTYYLPKDVTEEQIGLIEDVLSKKDKCCICCRHNQIPTKPTRIEPIGIDWDGLLDSIIDIDTMPTPTHLADSIYWREIIENAK